MMDKEKVDYVIRSAFEDYDAEKCWGMVGLTVLSKEEIKYGMEKYSELSVKTILKIYEWHALRGYSRKSVNDELKNIGVPLSIIKEAMMADENNWFEAALRRCKKYESQFHTTARELRHMMKDDGFTADEINYSLFNLNADWKEQALLNIIKQVKYKVNFEDMLRKLKDDGFKKEEIGYAERNLDDVKEEFEKIKEIIEKKLNEKDKI